MDEYKGRSPAMVGLVDALCVANHHRQVQKKRALNSARFFFSDGNLNCLHHIFDHLLGVAKYHHGLIEIEQLIVQASVT